MADAQDANSLLRDAPKISSKIIMEYSENDDLTSHEKQDKPDNDKTDMEAVPVNDNMDINGILKNVNNDDILTNSINGTKKKVKRFSELEKLKIVNGVLGDQFDGFEGINGVYRKYKFRGAQQKQKIEAPVEQPSKPKKQPKRRRISIDDETINCECQQCGKGFQSKTGLLNHMRMHQTKKKYTCSLCFDVFDSNTELIKHKDVHVAEKRTYICNQCKLAFTDHCDFLVHSVSHTNRSHYKCIECGQYYDKNGYKTHLHIHFNKQLTCHICKVVVNGEYNFRNHVNGHKYTKICEECGKNCKNVTYYKYHMLSHTGIKPYQCLYCGKGFFNNSQKRVHTRIHTDERPFTCETCGNKFKQYTDWQRHKITHDKIKKFQCDYCQKQFLHKNYLIIHMKGHVQKMYECKECSASFTGIAGLRTHTMFKHLSDRPVRCEACNKGFINKNQYDKHARSKYHKRNIYGLSLNKKKEESE